MSVQGALNTSIYAKLNGATNAAAQVYYQLAPDNTALPYIIFDYVNEGDDNKSPHRAKNVVISIRAYASTPSAANVIDGQVDVLLHLQALTVTGWTTIWVARENGYSTIEVDAAGRKIYMSGADYRIRTVK